MIFGRITRSPEKIFAMLHCTSIPRKPAIQLGLTTLLLSSITVNAKDTITMEIALDYAWIFTKVIIACSPVLAIVGILVFAREDDEEEAAKRKIKCAKS